MSSRSDPARQHVLWTLGMVVLTATAVWAIIAVRQALLLIYVSGLLAAGFAPLVRVIERQRLLAIGTRIPRWLAILVVYLAILTVLGAIALVVLPPFVQQARAFWAHLPDLLQRGQRFLVERGILTEPLTVGTIVQQGPSGSDVVGTVLLGFWGLFGGILGTFTVLILTFYLLVDADQLFRGFLRLFPAARRARIRATSEEMATKVSAWLTGQLILSTVIGCTSAIGLGLIGIPYFYVLAVIAAVGELIPYVGPMLAAVPGVAVAAGTSPRLALGVALFYFVQQQTESNLLVPKVMERQVGLNAVGVIVALLLGGSLLGIPGAILAVPTAAIVQVFVLQLVAED